MQSQKYILRPHEFKKKINVIFHLFTTYSKAKKKIVSFAWITMNLLKPILNM
jgi:hypothetical protein